MDARWNSIRSAMADWTPWSSGCSASHSRASEMAVEVSRGLEASRILAKKLFSFHRSLPYWDWSDSPDWSDSRALRRAFYVNSI